MITVNTEHFYIRISERDCQVSDETNNNCIALSYSIMAFVHSFHYLAAQVRRNCYVGDGMKRSNLVLEPKLNCTRIKSLAIS